MRIVGLASLAAGITLLGGSAAWADLPAATGNASCQSSSGTTTGASGCSAGLASATRTLSPDAALTATTSYPGGFYPSTDSSFDTLTYSFEVVGGSAGDIVPIDIAYSLTASITGDGYAFSEITATPGGDIYFAPSTGYKVICSDPICADRSSSYSGIFNLTAKVGLAGTIALEIEVASNYGPGSSASSASADPYIYVDPSFANASDYRIEVSPGVTNGGVPEPATWALMLGGFGLAGAALRRQRTTFVA